MMEDRGDVEGEACKRVHHTHKLQMSQFMNHLNIRFIKAAHMASNLFNLPTDTCSPTCDRIYINNSLAVHLYCPQLI